MERNCTVLLGTGIDVVENICQAEVCGRKSNMKKQACSVELLLRHYCLRNIMTG